MAKVTEPSEAIRQPSDPVELVLRYADGASANEARRLIELQLLDVPSMGSTSASVREAVAAARDKHAAMIAPKPKE